MLKEDGIVYDSYRELRELREVREDYEISDFEENGELCFDAFRGLEEIYSVKRPEVKKPSFKDIVFELDGKKYKFTVLEVE